MLLFIPKIAKYHIKCYNNFHKLKGKNIMDGKLLILCDELPKDYDGYTVRDIYFLKSEILLPEDDTQRIFVTWDAVIPKDRTFIDQCHKFARTYEQMPADFILNQTGAIDGKNGNIKGSLQEESFMNALEINYERVKRAYAKGEDYQAEAIDLAVQYPMQASQQFFEYFSAILKNNGILRILPTHSKSTDIETIRYRNRLLEAWQNQNRLMRENASYAELLEPLTYEDFIEAYSKSGIELMKIMALPVFGKKAEEPQGKGSK